jgi:hypothetical protein
MAVTPEQAMRPAAPHLQMSSIGIALVAGFIENPPTRLSQLLMRSAYFKPTAL